MNKFNKFSMILLYILFSYSLNFILHLPDEVNYITLQWTAIQTGTLFRTIFLKVNNIKLSIILLLIVI